MNKNVWKPYPTRGNGALVLHAWTPVECPDCDELSSYHRDGDGHDRCAVCGRDDPSECYDDPYGKFRQSVALRAAIAFGDWPKVGERWAW